MVETSELWSLVKRLNQIGIALSAEHSLGRLLNMIVSELRSFTRSDGGSLYIKQGDMLSFEVAQNATLEKRLGRIPFKSFQIPISHKSIAGYVASTGEIINIPDLDMCGDEVPFSLATMRDFDCKNDLKTVSMLAVPIRNHKEEIIGVVQLINALDENGGPIPFDPWMVELVNSLSSQAGMAIENSILIADIKRLFESLVTYSAQAIDARSPHTAGHSMRVSKLVIRQAETINRMTAGPFAEISFTEESMNELRMAAWLHDIGKIGVHEYVLDKVNKISDDRTEVVSARFAYLREMYRMKAAERKIAVLSGENSTGWGIEEIDRLCAETIAGIDDDLAFILKVNRPGRMGDEDAARLRSIAGKTYPGPDGLEKPYIEAAELECLLVARGNLTEAERLEIQSHVYHTLKILEQIPFTEELAGIPKIAAAHHEMLDGSGYPNSLKAGDIPFQAQMIAVADIYDALTARDRPYKPPLPHETAVSILREEASKGKLDRDLVELFVTEQIHTAI